MVDVAGDVMSNFLIKIAFDQDERSKKKFDEGLKSVQDRANEFGDKIAELPVIVSEATKRISASLSELWYSAQKTGASAEQIDSLRRAATQSGEGADNAERSWNSFSETLRKFGEAAGRQLKTIFGIDYNPNDKFGAFLQARAKAVEEYNSATDKEGKGRALARAQVFGIDEEALIRGRQDIFAKYFEKQLIRNAGLEGEKAAALTRAYNALADALDTVARKADAAIFDKFGSVLDRLTRWLDEDSERIVKFFVNLATQIGLVFEDLSKLGPAFKFLWEALKELGDWLQKIIGQPDSSGLAGVRHLLELISGVVMIRFVASMVAGFTAAFAPVTALLLALGALGIIGVGAYTAGEAVGNFLGGGGDGTGGSEGSGGHGAERRRKFGHGGAVASGGGKLPEGSLRSRGLRLMNDLIAKGWTPESAAMAAGNAESESGINPSGPPGDLSKGWEGRAVGMWQDRLDRRVALQDFKARHPEMSEWEANIAYYDQEAQQQSWKHEHNMARAAKFSHATEGYGDSTEGVRVRRSNAWLRLYNEEKNKTHSSPPIPNVPQDFHKRLDEIRSAKPLAPWQQSSNEINDHRTVTNDVNIHVAGGFPVEKTTRPLERPKNADLIRNTTSYAA